MKKEWAGLGTRTSDPVYNQEWIEAIQNENLLTCLELVLRTSLIRTESRGAAYRRDHPETNNRDWLKNLVVTRGDQGQPRIEERPIVVTSLTPPNDIRPYGHKRLVGPGGES